MTEDKPETEQKPSRSARKREALALQKLGTELLKLRPEQISLIPLHPSLEKAILDYHRIRSNGAKKRQVQFIGKLMRDEDFEAIQEALKDLNRSSSAAQYQHHQLELWRNKLLAEPNALTEYLNEHPKTDIQNLRVLIRQAKSAEQKNAEPNNPTPEKKYLRQLFRFLRDNQQLAIDSQGVGEAPPDR